MVGWWDSGIQGLEGGGGTLVESTTAGYLLSGLTTEMSSSTSFRRMVVFPALSRPRHRWRGIEGKLVLGLGLRWAGWVGGSACSGIGVRE